MKTIEVNLLKFNELSDDAKETAIEKYREQIYTNHDISNWVIDDCYLFEPLNNELTELFGNEYEKLEKPIIGNTRKVYFDTGRSSFLDADEAIKINNEKLFLLWLGIPESMHDNLCYYIVNNIARYPNTIIEFNPNYYDYEFRNDELIILEIAKYKFYKHMKNVLNRIEDSIEYFYSDDYLEQQLEDSEDYFTENGIKY